MNQQSDEFYERDIVTKNDITIKFLPITNNFKKLQNSFIVHLQG